jgi:hypothetical protein
MPNNSAEFAPCSLLRPSPSKGRLVLVVFQSPELACDPCVPSMPLSPKTSVEPTADAVST